MSNKDWDKASIKRLTTESGRPLEIICASAFINAGWQVQIGTYFEDGLRVRELDVLIEKNELVEVDANKVRVGVRVLGSAKGFPTDQSPVTYSVSKDNPAVCTPTLVTGHRNANKSYGKLNAFDESMATYLINAAELLSTPPVIGFDIFKRQEKTSKGLAEVEYQRKTDRELYEGLDSAIKATAFWAKRDLQDGSSYATLNVPLLLMSMPFWDISIDQGSVGEPELRSAAYSVGLYPRDGYMERPTPILALLCEVKKLDMIVKALGLLCDCFTHDMSIALKAGQV